MSQVSERRVEARSHARDKRVAKRAPGRLADELCAGRGCNKYTTGRGRPVKSIHRHRTIIHYFTSFMLHEHEGKLNEALFSSVLDCAKAQRPLPTPGAACCNPRPTLFSAEASNPFSAFSHMVR
jgi:hypothetical protein